MGSKGVDLFVVISGFCLYYPIAKRRREKLPTKSALTFLYRRAQRILPVYFVAIAFSLVFLALRFRIAPYQGIADILAYASLTMNSMPEYVGRINGPLWSVAMEGQLYLLMPLMAWAIGRFGLALPTATAIAISLLAAIVGAGVLTFGPYDLLTSTSMLPRLCQFVCGIIVASWALSPRRWHLPVAICAAILVAPIPVVAYARTLSLGWIDQFSLAASGVVFAGIILASYKAEQRGWLVGRRLGRILVPISFVGLISYSLYAIHFPVMLAMQPMVEPLMGGAYHSLLVYTLIGLPATLVAACGMFWLVERWSIPCVRWNGMRLAESPRIPTASKQGASVTP